MNAVAVGPHDAFPKEQLDLIRKTVAQGATDTELQLFLYDCQRRGIHPLDKLLHFTKRGGRYTPVTSIDFMRSQAAASGEMAGSDDPHFEFNFDPESLRPLMDKPPRSASVTVYRLTQGQRFAYTATARWSEYCPDNAPMWKRMPHTMLGKCAEALALRKAFPQQLAGLYSAEEMDQATKAPAYVVEAPAAESRQAMPALNPAPAAGESAGSSLRSPNSLSSPSPLDASMAPSSPNVGAPFDDDGLYISKVEVRETNNKNVRKQIVILSDGRELSTFNPALGALAENLCQERRAVLVQTKANRLHGEELVTLVRADEVVL